MTLRSCPPAAGGLILAALVALAGCSSAPPTSYYTLASVPPASGAAAAPVLAGPAPVVAVGPVTLPDYIDRPQIVTRTSAYALALASDAQWGGPLVDMLPRTLTEDVAMRLTDARVVSFPQVSGAGFDYRVSVDISRFDVTTDGLATLAARWQVYDRTAQRAVTVTEATFTQQAKGSGYEAYAAALSATLAELSGRLAAAVEAARGSGFSGASAPASLGTR